MEIEYKKCRQNHLRYITAQLEDVHNKVAYLSPEFENALLDHFAISAWIGNRCVAAAGIITVHEHRGIAWALMGADAGPYMTQLTRKVRRAIDLHPCKRVEMTVNYEFEEGHRWAKLLGMTCDAPRLRYHGAYGNDETLYSRIK